MWLSITAVRHAGRCSQLCFSKYQASSSGFGFFSCVRGREMYWILFILGHYFLISRCQDEWHVKVDIVLVDQIKSSAETWQL